MRCAIYARVSTRDGRQEVQNQITQLTRYAQSQSWTLVEFIDHESGSRAERPEFQRLLLSASRREIDVVLVWSLDRFTREGVCETFRHLERLQGYGVQFESLTEPHFRTTGPAGELLTAIYAWIAKQERVRMRERIQAGLAHAREHGTRSGKAIGRPRRIFNRDEARELIQKGLSFRAVGARLGVGEATVRRACK